MEIFGLHEYIRDVTRRLAKAGAFAIAPNYYFRSGEDLTKITEMPKLMPIVNAKPDAELFADLDATAAWAKSQGGNTGKLGIIGFCRGGRTVWEYSPTTRTSRPASRSTARWSIRRRRRRSGRRADRARARREGAGARPLRREDTGIPVAQVEAMKEALAKANKKTAEFKIYPGAPHGFHADYRPSYRKEAAEDAWKMAIDWLKKNKVLSYRSTGPRRGSRCRSAAAQFSASMHRMRDDARQSIQIRGCTC